MCCNGDIGINDLEITFNHNIGGSLVGFSVPASLHCSQSELGATLTLDCAKGIPTGADIRLAAEVGLAIVSAEWTRNNQSVGPATAVPEPESLALFASGLLSLPLGVAVRHRLRNRFAVSGRIRHPSPDSLRSRLSFQL